MKIITVLSILILTSMAQATPVEEISRNWITARFERCGKVNSAANVIHAKNPMTMTEISKSSECAETNSTTCLALMDRNMKAFVKNNYKNLAIQCDLSGVDINFAYLKMYKESLYPKGSQEALEVEKATAKGKSYDANIACKYKKMKYARDKKTDEHSCWEVFDCSNVKKFNFGGHALDGGEYLFRCDATAKDKQGCNDVSLSQCNPISYQSQSTFEQIGKGLTGYQPPIIDVRNRR